MAGHRSHSRNFDQRRLPDAFLTGARHCLLLSDEDDQPLAASDAGIKADCAAAAIEAKIARAAVYRSCGGFDGFARAVLRLRAEIGVPHTLKGLKVDAAKRELIADMALVDPTAGGNPVPLTRDAALRIFDAALTGEVPSAWLPS